MSRRTAVQALGAATVTMTPPLAALAAQPALPPAVPLASSPPPLIAGDWDSVRAQFSLDPTWIHMGGLLFASHPAPVRQAIETLRRELDANPVHAVHAGFPASEEAARSDLARYFGVDPADLALTDSTTMGLGLLYSGLRLNQDSEVITSEHDHYATHESLRLACERSGAKLTKINLYEHGAAFEPARAVAALKAALTTRTRVVALTWVHSSTGVRLPLRQLADVIDWANEGRSADARIVFCVDGVHGTGIENVELPELGCDFFVAGTHKWLFGPRGTGILWGRKAAQARVAPSIPTFSTFGQEATWGRSMTPGGFHTFEHRWAAGAAATFHLAIGKARVEERIHALSTRMKDGLAAVKGLTLHTPRASALSSGIVCFEIDGLAPEAIVEALAEKRIIATATPYKVSYARVTPSLLNTTEEVDRTIAAIGELARSRGTRPT
jgi:selenocysteine lyase/cysteine desulfurase